MDRRQLIAAGALGAGLLAIGIAVFSPASDEEEIRELLDRTAAAVSFTEPMQNPVIWGSTLSGKFEDLFTDQIDVRVPEAGATLPGSRGMLGLAAAKALSRYGDLDVSIAEVSITVQGDTAQADATAVGAGTLYGQTRMDRRRVQFGLVKDGGDWKIRDLLVQRAQ